MCREQTENSQSCIKDNNYLTDQNTVMDCSNSTIDSYIQDVPSLNRKVSFDRIHIREYYLSLGDNPSCSSGPPLSISWKYSDIGSVDLEEFEMMRPPRRHHSEMMIPSIERKKLLDDLGYSVLEIVEAVKNVTECKKNRKKSLRSIDYKFLKCFERSSKIMNWLR